MQAWLFVWVNMGMNHFLLAFGHSFTQMHASLARSCCSLRSMFIFDLDRSFHGPMLEGQGLTQHPRTHRVLVLY